MPVDDPVHRVDDAGMETTIIESDGYARLSTPSPDGGRDLTVDVSDRNFLTDRSPDWQVNWSAFGSVAPDVAVAYAALLGKAAAFASLRMAAAA